MNGCPDGSVLAAFVFRQLDGDDLEAVSRHLTDCDDCYATVAAAARALAPPGSAPRPPAWPLVPAFVTALAIALALTAVLYLLL